MHLLENAVQSIQNGLADYAESHLPTRRIGGSRKAAIRRS
jgi:hypothetical protein